MNLKRSKWFEVTDMKYQQNRMVDFILDVLEKLQKDI